MLGNKESILKGLEKREVLILNYMKYVYYYFNKEKSLIFLSDDLLKSRPYPDGNPRIYHEVFFSDKFAEIVEADLPAAKPFEFYVSAFDSPGWKRVPPLTEELKEAIRVKEDIEYLFSEASSNSTKKIGSEGSEKIVSELVKSKMIWGVDLSNSYDSVSSGLGLFFDEKKSMFSCGWKTLHESGESWVEKVFFEGDEGSFKGWFKELSPFLLSLISSDTPELVHARKTINKSLPREIKRILSTSN